MASALNKRQQARNERALQELIKTVPGNGVCADCGVRNPGWASWSLGIFLCMRCGALHRKLGTHISKVKSLSMDKWDNAQVDNMKRIGNTESNKIYNPRNVKAQMPIDVDEVDSAMERFIRQKYEQRAFMNDSRPGTRSNTGSSSSVEDRPPPLPPKPTKRFGFGIQKGPAPARNGTPPVSPGLGGFYEQGNSPPRVNKASRVFGSHVHTSGDGLESKLATLRDMGFPDDKRNATVLKGLNGNLDKAVEALIRLGEQAPIKSRGNTPTPPTKLDMNGLMPKKSQTMPPPAASTNPFDALDNTAPLPPLPHQKNQAHGGSVTQPTSPSGSYNPFLQQSNQVQSQQQAPPAQQQPQQFAHQTNPFAQPQPQPSLEQSFQALGLHSQQQTQQPLFPNRTGDYHQQPHPPFAPTNPFQQSFTPPPIPQMPSQYGSVYQPRPPQSQYQSLSSPTSPGNPFLKSARSQMFPPSIASSNPFGQFSHQQSQQQPPQQLSLQQPSNPFVMQQQQQTQLQTSQIPEYFQAPQTSNQQPQQPRYQQPQGAFDKNSIMALYDYPHLAPQRQEQQSQAPPAAALAPASAPSAPGSGQMNPFASAQKSQQPASAVPPQFQAIRHVSHESVDFAGLTGGRQSPDAFAGLSSSFRRP